jgi:hypothetical protein
VSIARYVPFRRDTSVVEQATISADALSLLQVRTHKHRRWALLSTTDCFGQRHIVYNFLRVPLSSVMFRKTILCGTMCCRYSNVLFPSCCLLIAARRVCVVQIEVTVIRILCRTIILSDNCRLQLPVGPCIVLT